MLENFATALRRVAAEVEPVLAGVLEASSPAEPELAAAMRYATLDGGKRLRVFLAVAGAELCGAPRDRALRAGAAVELVHCYSLVHDDLPAMDDDDLRRGRATVHKKFNEATAILAGDALLTLAFEVLADARTHPKGDVRAELVALLARASGAAGMVGGQALDLAAEGKPPHPLDAVLRLQRCKTGALLTCAAEVGAVLAAAPEEARSALRAFGADLGAAFQIADDLLDAVGDAVTVGKAVGKDAGAGKATVVGLLGLERARAEAQRLSGRAVSRLDLFGSAADLLRQAARFVVERKA